MPLSESDTRANCIDPALQQKNWQPQHILREYYFTDGRKLFGGRRGQPLYEYSLKEGINDGFLTPYKVKRIRTSLDEYVYTSDDKVVKGQVSKNVYGVTDFDKNIIIPERTETIARAILQHMQPMGKTILFCVDQTIQAYYELQRNLYKA